jgi:Mn-containing catalase
MAVDGGDGLATVQVTDEERTLLDQMAARTMSDPEAEPLTGAELGMGIGQNIVGKNGSSTHP